MTLTDIQHDIQQGIPSSIPPKKTFDSSVNHAPKRKKILSDEERKLALRNALRYFPKEQHEELVQDFAEEFIDIEELPNLEEEMKNMVDIEDELD